MEDGLEIKLAYGRTGLNIHAPDSAAILQPKSISGLDDPESALLFSLDAPIGGPPLKNLVAKGQKVVILHTDITRATPNRLILPVILDYLLDHGVAPEDIVLINGLGTHRRQTQEEMVQLLGEDILKRFRCLQHDCRDQENLTLIGESSSGHPIWINKAVVEADLRILTGFIEPHFFAGFSGGPKAIMPGIAGLQTIQDNHGYEMIADPQATFGVTEGNPVWMEMMEVVRKLGPSFLLDVTMNTKNEITQVFAGDVFKAHQAGCQFAKENAMAAVSEPFDIVITSNSGYPLDQNLYQSIKGISAASQIVRKGGAVLLAARCIEGLPEYGGYAQILRKAGSVDGVLEMLQQPGFSMQDQWQVQIQARVQKDADVFVYSEGLSDKEIRTAFMTPCDSIDLALPAMMRTYGHKVCVIPDGPLTIPYVHR